MAKRSQKKSGLFLQLVGNGKMGMYVSQPTENSEPYTNASGVTKNYEFFESIEGKLSNVYLYDKDLGKGKKIEMLVIQLINDEGNKESLEMPFNSPYAQSLIVRLEEIDTDKNVEIKTFKIKDKEKSLAKGKDIFNELCLPYQNGKVLENLYKKDGSKKLPQAVATEVKEKGKKVLKYDFTEQREALRDIVTGVKSNLKSDTNTYDVNQEDTDSTLPDDDDMPF